MRCKEKVKEDLDRIMDVGIIKAIEESEWISLNVVQYNKATSEVCVCVDLRKLNDACLHDPFLTPSIDEVLENVRDQ